MFEEAKKRRQQLMELLSKAPVVEVLGVVSPTGASGGRGRGEELWTMKFRLEAWRVAGGEIQSCPITIHRTVTENDLKSIQARIGPYAVMRIKARIVTDSPFGGADGLLEDVIGRDNSDAALNASAAKLQEPVQCEDAAFGAFTLDRRVNTFEGAAVWMDRKVALRLDAAGPKEMQAALATARALWSDLRTWDNRIRDCAVKKLLTLKNDEWLAEGESELNAEQFKEKMLPESVTVEPDGSFDFWFADGDMFWGHAILVSGSLACGPGDAGIHG